MRASHLRAIASCVALIGAAIATPATAAIILNYDLTGLVTTPAPTSVAPTAEDPAVDGADLVRGPGINPAGLTNGFSSDNWTTAGASRDAAIAAGDYYQWGFTVDPGYLVSLATLDFSLRRSAVAAPMNYLVQASLDGFTTPGVDVATFNYFGRSSGTAPGVVVPGQWMTTDTPGQNAGNPVTPPIALATIPSLQAITGGSTVTFRLYAWGDGTGADTNTVALGRINGPLIQGTAALVPEPAAIALCGSALIVGLVARRRR
jgi:hypothetical protein